MVGLFSGDPVALDRFEAASVSHLARARFVTIFMQRLTIWFLLSLLFLLLGCQPGGSFGPLAGTATPSGELVRQPVQVSFAQLNEDPAAFHEKYIRISGAYLQLPPPACNPLRGPAFLWSLADLAPVTGDRLRVDALGFEDVIWLVQDGTPMTIEGFWRLYEGPLGCGKNAPREAMWYVEVLRILEPNPLPGAGSPRGTPAPAEGGLDIQITPLATFTPQATATGEVTGTASPTLAPTMTASPEPLLTPTETITATATLVPGVTPTISSTPTVTATVADTPTAGAPPTETPDSGYPPPVLPTNTPEGYP